MLRQPTTEALTDSESVAGHDPAPAVYCYTVTAVREPSVLPRVVEMFTLRDLVPSAVHCQHAGEEELRLDVEVAGLDDGHAEHLAARMRNIMPVVSVLLRRR